jgi:hypothetical protein
MGAIGDKKLLMSIFSIFEENLHLLFKPAVSKSIL